MKKLFLLLITIVSFANVSYASFPADTNKKDTANIIKETTEQYHQRMEKQGFDIEDCMCVDCRKFKNILISEQSDVNLSPEQAAKINILFLGSAILIALVTLAIYTEGFEDVPPIILPIILTICLLFYLLIILNKIRKESELK